MPAFVVGGRSWNRAMYLPETNAQMFDILTDLRIYAAMNGMPLLAEKLDDALMLLLAETRGPAPVTRPGLETQDTL